ncbi:MAG: ComF family protein [Planctomycetota bacterium]
MHFFTKQFFNFLAQVLDIFFPRFCVICNRPFTSDAFEHNYLCKRCFLVLPKPPERNVCLKCKDFLGQFLLTKPVCQQCKKYRHLFKRLITPLYYKDEVEKLIWEFKFNKGFYLGRLFTQLLIGKIREEIPDFNHAINLVTFVPMSYSEKMKRGFNQSEFIAKIIGKGLKLKVYSVLRKTRPTRPQRELNFFHRQENVKDAFCVKKQYKNLIEGKNILLVDDIYTTGATLAECCKVLKENKVKKIYLAVLARNIRR